MNSVEEDYLRWGDTLNGPLTGLAHVKLLWLVLKHPNHSNPGGFVNITMTVHVLMRVTMGSSCIMVASILQGKSTAHPEVRCNTKTKVDHCITGDNVIENVKIETCSRQGRQTMRSVVKIIPCC